MKAVSVIVLMCLVACCAAQAQQCSTLQRLLVKKEWSNVFGTSLNREDFGGRIFKQLYKTKPDSFKFFERVGGTNIYKASFVAHAQRVLGGLDICIALLDDPDTLAAQLNRLQAQHIDRGITADYFQALTDVILDIMPEYMGGNYHNLQSWVDCLGVIQQGIQFL